MSLLTTAPPLGSVLHEVVELVADAIVGHPAANDVLEPIIMALDLERVRYNRLNPVVVAGYFHLVDHSELVGAA